MHTLLRIQSLFAFLLAACALATVARAEVEAPTSLQLIAKGSSWQYLDDGTDQQGTGWKELEFSDTWKVGDSELGYGNVDLTRSKTELDYGAVGETPPVTTYFRKSFDVNLSQLPSGWEPKLVRISVKASDAFVAYINGVEVDRYNLPDQTASPNVAYSQVGLAEIEGSDELEDQVTVLGLPPGFLYDVGNVLSIEVHRSEEENEDITFDAKLELIIFEGDEPRGILTPIRNEYTWKYDIDGVDLGTGWRGRSYSDSNWASGVAPLGYGNSTDQTRILFGENAQDKHITSYYRKEFTLEEGIEFDYLFLDLLADDGVILYVNGTEIIRQNMPGSSVDYQTTASTEYIYGQGRDSRQFVIQLADYPNLLIEGVNVVSAEVHQVSNTDDDSAFDMSLSAGVGHSYRYLLRPLFEGEPLPSFYQGKSLDELTIEDRFKVTMPVFDEPLVAPESEWKYEASGDFPGANWAQTSFVDETWSFGAGELGYVDGDEVTTISSGATTVYFRKKFNVTDASTITNLLLRIRRDDGVVAYLNGDEVFRENMPAGLVDETTLALENVESTSEDAFEEYYYTTVIQDPSTKLHDGENVLAIEIHQHASGASDLSFDAQLIQNDTIESFRWVDFHDGKGFRDPFGDSPELRSHTTLNDFVDDMGGDPVALAAFVQNEIGLVDGIPFNSNTSGSNVPLGIYPTKINRGAYATFMEKQGAPVEQCALLVYLLRRSGHAVAYVDGPRNTLRFDISRLSNMLRLQLDGFVPSDSLMDGITSRYNATWIMVYDESLGWMPLFPWLKDTVIEEGFDFYDFLPVGYQSPIEWTEAYLKNDPEIHDLVDDGDDTVAKLLMRFGEKHLAKYGLSLDDVGIKAYDRKSSYRHLSDFPRPLYVSDSSSVDTYLVLEESRVLPDLRDSSDFTTVTVTASQEGASSVSATFNTADIHNRKFFANFSDGQLNLRLGVFDPLADASLPEGDFDFSDSNIRAKQLKQFTANENVLNIEMTYSDGVLSPSSVRSMPAGSIAGICFSWGDVTEEMLEVHANEFWSYKRSLSEPAPADYTSAMVYLTGMSYFNRVSVSDAQLANLNKIRLHSIALGVTTLEPGANDTSVSVPGVDMPFTGLPLWNGSIYPGSNIGLLENLEGVGLINIANTSSHEHEVLDQMFDVEHSISTVKLLQISHRENQAVYPPDGFYTFNDATLPEPGSGLYIDNSMIRSVHERVDGRPMVHAYITPIEVSSEDLETSYTGHGGLLIGVSRTGFTAGALISGEKAGGSGMGFNSSYLNQGSFDSWNLNSSGSGNYNVSFNDYSSTSNFNTSSYSSWSAPVTSVWDMPSVSSNVSSGYTSFSPDVYSYSGNAASSLGFYENSSTFDLGNLYQDIQNVGLISTSTSSFSQATMSNTFVSDPVNVTTGEFYIDANDLTLPGPFPLTMRRNYSSLNEAPNEFGYGWNFAYVPYLSVKRDPSDAEGATPSEPLIYAADPDGSVIAYALDENTDDHRIWRPTQADNPNLKNYNGGKVGALDNPFNAYIKCPKTNPTTLGNTYTLYRADGSRATYTRKSFTVTSYQDVDDVRTAQDFTWERPYIDRLEDAFGNYFTFEYGQDTARTDYGHMTRIESSSGNFIGFYYNTTGQIIEAYSGDGRRLYYEYSDYGDLIKVTLPDHSEIRYEYKIAKGSQADEAEIRGDFTMSGRSAADSDHNDKYGTRVRGWIEPDIGGNYTFFIKGDDGTRLFLSTDEDPANKVEVIDRPGYTPSYSDSEDGKHTQKLVAGQRYYVEAYHKEGIGGDNLSVAWTPPGSSRDVIPEANLIPWNPIIAGSNATQGLLWEYWNEIEGNEVSALTDRIAETVRPYSTHLLTRVIKPDGRILENVYGEGYANDSRKVTLQRGTTGQTLELVESTGYRYNPDAFKSWTDEGYQISEVVDLSWPGRKPTVGDSSHAALAEAVTTYIFDADNRLLLIADPLADRAQLASPPATLADFDVTQYGDHILAYEWDANLDGEPVLDVLSLSVSKIKDKSGLITEFAYDDRGNPTVVQLKGALTGDVTSVDGNGVPTLKANETLTTNYYYNDRDQMVMEVSQAPGQSTNNYNKVIVHEFPDTGSALSIADSRDSDYIAYAYRSLNSKSYSLSLGSVDPDTVPTISGTPIATTQNFFGADVDGDQQAHGLLKRIVTRAGDESGAIVSDVHWTHDSRGYPITSTQVLEGPEPDLLTTFDYDDRGKLVAQTDPTGAVSRFAYDDLGRLKWEERYKNAADTTPDNFRYLYYNLNGDMIWEDGPRTGAEDYIFRDYDGDGRMIAEVVWRSEVNASEDGVQGRGGNFNEADPSAFFNEQSITFYEYDIFGNMTKSIDPRGNETFYEYDALGQLVTSYYYDTEGNPVAAKMEYDAGGRVVKSTNSLDGEAHSAFTDTGLPVFESSPDGARSYTHYYADGRIRTQTLPNGSVVSMTYDDVNLTEQSVLRESADGSSTMLNKSIVTFDVRGQPISRKIFTESGGSGTPLEYTSEYDYAGRIVSTTGPASETAASGAVSKQQSSKTYYINDTANNQMQSIVRSPINDSSDFPAVEAVTVLDHLGRTIEERIRQVDSADDSSPEDVRVTSYVYSDDKQSVTVTQGTDTSVDLETQTFTDTFGNVVLSMTGKSGVGGARVYTKVTNRYDAAGNLVLFIDEEDRPTEYSYDHRNRLEFSILPDDALLEFKYDALDNLTHRMMPGDLTWRSNYTNAGQIDAEWLEGSDGSQTRYMDYSYDGAGDSFPGSLRSVAEKADPTASTHLLHTYDYDAAWRTESISTTSPNGSYPELNVSMAYNFRGFMTDAVRGPPTANPDIPTVRLHLDYDAYGQLREEKVEEGTGTNVDDFVATSTHSHFYQSWDGLGRRETLAADGATLPATLPANFNGSYGFTYKGSGQLDTITGPYGHHASYEYSDNGLLHTRELRHRDGALVKTVSIPTATGRRADGRILSRETQLPTASDLVAETLSYYADSRVETYGVQRGAGSGSTWANFSETRGYNYNDRGQLTTVTDYKQSPTSAVAAINYGFDANKLGVRTSASISTDPDEDWQAVNNELDVFGRIDAENLHGDVLQTLVSLEGTALGAGSVNLSLNDVPIGAALMAADGSGDWTLDYDLVPGDYQLDALAQHAYPGSSFTAADTVNFQVTGGAEEGVTEESTFDGSGRTLTRTSRTGQVEQLFSWDPDGNLIKVEQLNHLSTLSDVPSYVWTAVYDPLGRRMRSTYTPLDAAGAPVPASAVSSSSWYDPEVEFLELVVETGGERFWKLHGPDFDAGYGGFNGVGGLEAVVVESSGEWSPLVSNQFGHVLASIETQGTATSDDDTVAWRELAYGGYGVMPGYEVPTLNSLETGQNYVDTLLWQGRSLDATGWYRMGARDYDPVAGRFLSPDPLGHVGSMDLYSYADGDPINRIDSDGRIGVNMFEVQNQLSYALPQSQGSALQQVADWSYGIADSVYSFMNPSESLYQRDQRNSNYYSFRQEIPILQQQLTDMAVSTPFVGGFIQMSRGNISGGLKSLAFDTFDLGLTVITAGGSQSITAPIRAARFARTAYKMSRGAFKTGMKRMTSMGSHSGYKLPKPGGIKCACLAAGMTVLSVSGEVPIEAVQVGDRVLSAEELSGDYLPEAQPTEVDAETWRKVTAIMANDGDWSDQLEITMLRPAAWLDAMGAAPGTWITLTQDGIEHQGTAKVLAIEDCPQIVDAPGTVVLSTIRRVSPDWMEIYVAGAEAAIEVSQEHPFFVDSVNDWVFSGDLEVGQSIKTREGVVAIERLVRHDATRAVFNLEIEETHTYYVGSSEVLGHNCNMPAGGWGSKPKSTVNTNSAAGKEWQRKVNQSLDGKYDNAQEVTLKVNTANGVKRIRVDNLIRDPNSKSGYLIVENKASATAKFTKNQKVALPKLAVGGVAEVRGSKAYDLFKIKSGQKIKINGVLVVRPTGVSKL